MILGPMLFIQTFLLLLPFLESYGSSLLDNYEFLTPSLYMDDILFNKIEFPKITKECFVQWFLGRNQNLKSLQRDPTDL